MDKELSADAQKAILKRWLELPQAIRYGPVWHSPQTHGHIRFSNYRPAHLLNPDQTKTLCNRPQGHMVAKVHTFDPRKDCRKCRDKALLLHPKKERPDAIPADPPTATARRL